MMFKRVISRIVQSDICWKILDESIIKTAKRLERARKTIQRNKIVLDALHKFKPGLVVQGGPFKGMKYPERQSIGSTFFPKFLGCYEIEIQQIVNKVCKTPYSEIIDIGCAEGYYAVGFAIQIPKSIVYAFDTNEEAIRLCRKMAVLNNVDDRVVTGKFCDHEILKAIPYRGKSLIFCDCEGYEKELFNKEIVEHLLEHDLIIEIHDGIDPDISYQVLECFKNTHEIERIEVMRDEKKLRTFSYTELERYDISQRKMLISEDRLESTEWFYMQSKGKK